MRPIPYKILTHTVTFNVCTGVDMWQEPVWSPTVVSRVCMQPCHETRKTDTNTEVLLRSLLFVDAVRSIPAGLDIEALQIASEAAGQPMQVIFEGKTYTVLTVETLFSDTGEYHHTEVGLV